MKNLLTLKLLLVCTFGAAADNVDNDAVAYGSTPAWIAAATAPMNFRVYCQSVAASFILP